MQGAYVHQRLSFGFDGQACSLTKCVRAEVRTGLGKSDRPGSQGGCEKRDYGSRIEAQGESTGIATGPYRARAHLLSRQLHVRFDEGDQRLFSGPYSTCVRSSLTSLVN